MKLWQLHGIAGKEHVVCGMMCVKLRVGLHQTKQEDVRNKWHQPFGTRRAVLP